MMMATSLFATFCIFSFWSMEEGRIEGVGRGTKQKLLVYGVNLV